jgi:hypothetical protein
MYRRFLLSSISVLFTFPTSSMLISVLQFCMQYIFGICFVH